MSEDQASEQTHDQALTCVQHGDVYVIFVSHITV